MYSIIASTSRTFFSNINPTNGEIRVKGDLFQTGVSVFEITIHARDNPGSNAVSRFDMATVTITVTRPVFTSATYNATISEYLPVQQSVIRTVATDADPANTPSGTIDYSIEYISSTLTNGFAQFLVSPTDGSIYISQPLTRINVPAACCCYRPGLAAKVSYSDSVHHHHPQPACSNLYQPRGIHLTTGLLVETSSRRRPSMMTPTLC
ncbi:cadherin-23-like isoform X2 [Mya arenaria]|uniref:cadherin-23-like isoform X1 n=1 Tax=Mya arenaria TaxID=6604 RepID=UPI0022E8180B|nr:cadherin-23-like isoform X1 [Mya arenaria]XP_052814754.1 cadherin-23-like isoform X2 [Mya arenaria]